MRTLALAVLLAASHLACSGDDSGDDGGGGDGGDATPGGQLHPGVRWEPRPGTSWQWQLDGTIDTSFDVEMYDVDLVETPISTINALHAAGRIVVCYFSAGTHENYRPDASEFPASAIGKTLEDWPNERWIDTRDPTVRGIMERRLDRARDKGCDGVEPDNVDGYANDSGFPDLTAATQADFNRFLAAAAHARGLSVGLKNDLDQIEDLVSDFDWALNEECMQYDECERLVPFIQAGKAVFHVEYGPASLADTVCPASLALDFDTLIKDHDLDPWRVACR